MTENLWAIYTPGPDNFQAAPSESAAHHMAKKINGVMTEYIEMHPELVAPHFGFLREAVMSSVAEWPGTPESHQEDLKDFDYAGWEIEKPETI